MPAGKTMQIKTTSGSGSAGLGIIGTGLALALPRAEWIGWLLVLAGFLVFVLDVRIERGHVAVGSPQSLQKRLRLMWPQYLMVFSGMLFFVGLIGFLQLNVIPPLAEKEKTAATPSPESAPSRPVVLHAKCGQPDISPFVRTGAGRFVFPFSPVENRITHGLLELDKEATLTPEPEKTPSVVMQCSITNYGPVAILNTRLTLGIEFRKAIPQGDHGSIGGEVVQQVDWPIDVAKIEAGENKSFIFYLWNTSPHFAMVRIYDNVSFQRVDENEGRIVKLIQPQINPNFPLLFPPTGDTTNKPN
jgi:hypothetical protein